MKIVFPAAMIVKQFAEQRLKNENVSTIFFFFFCVFGQTLCINLKSSIVLEQHDDLMEEKKAV